MLWYRAIQKLDGIWKFVYCKANPPNPNDPIVDGNDPTGVLDGNVP